MNPQTVIPKVYRFKMESLLNVKTQKVEAADYWLSQGKSIIQKLEISIKEKRKQYACPCCKTPVVLRYGKRRLPWFAHPVLENTQECRHVASKVKPKSSEEETLVPDSPKKVEQASDQKSTETRIIPFYSNDSTWDSTLGVSGVNYFVTSNDLSVVPTNDTRQTDEAVSQESVHKH